MANINNLRIITDNGELVYKQAEDLGITFNRIVDDFTAIDNRFGDFSYDFELPIVKENALVFGFADALGSKKIFVKNKNIPCQVYLNNSLLLDGLINLEGIIQGNYKCKFYSKFKELVDSLNEIDPTTGEEKTLRSLNLPVVHNWNYETSVVAHMNANYANCDETHYQFPLCFYSTNYCQTSYFTGHTDDQGNAFESDRDYQCYYYLFNSINADNNRMYIHQFPPAIYIVSIVKQILIDAGWKLGGQFFNDSNVKKIVLTYAGDEDIYDQATLHVSGNTSFDLQIAKFLPDMNQADFLKSIINYFNLYFKIDVNNKVVEFETYNTYFNNADSINPYDITSKIDLSTVEFSYIEKNDPSIKFKKANNQNIMGDNRLMLDGNTNLSNAVVWLSGNSKNYNQIFNRVGTNDKIEVEFSEPSVKRHYIYNDYNISGSSQSAGVTVAYLPLMSKQTPNDNNNVKFNKKDTDTYVFNNEDTIKFQGEGSLMYFYGKSNSDFDSGNGAIKNYLYVNIYYGGNIHRVPIGFCSPFQLLNYRDEINSYLSTVTSETINDKRTAIATYLQTIWQMMGKAGGADAKDLTDYSLVFDDSGYFHKTLWTVFHKDKWERYANSELLTATMQMNAYDWQEMQINRPLLYNQELYNLVEIEGYDPILRQATIKMIKKY
jgi:hypothetical protein